MRPAFLVVDKPAGLTSHDVVRILRSVSGEKKVGHTGTLDPFATGVLPIALGRATKLIQFLDEAEKVYEATVALGTSTTTGDLEGEPLEQGGPPDLARIEAALAELTGELLQAPPAYSAVRVEGKRLYEYARAGVEKRAAPRPIRVHGWELLEASPEQLRVVVRCGRGTYVRVLGEDLARALGTRGHLSALRRLASGPFGLAGALDLPTLSRVVTGQEDWDRAFRRGRDAPDRLPWRPRAEVAEALAARTLPLVEAFAEPRVELDAADRRRLGFGQRVAGPAGRWVATFEGRFCALMEGDRILRSLVAR